MWVRRRANISRHEQAEPLSPTFVNAASFRAFYWTGVKSGSAPVAYMLRGGNANGWQWS
jgi:hypothetical protein